jgi:hypothetical protein
MPPPDVLRASEQHRPSGDENRTRELLDNLALTVFELDLEGRLRYVNRAGRPCHREHGFGDVLAQPYRVADISRVLSTLIK